MKSKTVLIELPIATGDGEFIAGYSERGLATMSFPSTRSKGAMSKTEVTPQIRCWHRLTSAALARMLAGKAAGELPPLDITVGSTFQKSVWNAMLKIPVGRTLSYGEIAKAIGNPKAVRAVGGACGANPIPVLVPCHRVLAAGGKIGGFSSGLDWKRKLLGREGIELAMT